MRYAMHDIIADEAAAATQANAAYIQGVIAGSQAQQNISPLAGNVKIGSYEISKINLVGGTILIALLVMMRRQ